MSSSKLHEDSFSLDHQIRAMGDRRLARAARQGKPHNIPLIFAVSAVTGLLIAFALLTIAPYFK